MRIERLVGMYIINDIGYTKYREAMMPLLSTYGGGFAYDFKIAEVLKSQTQKKINRVFIIYFENEKSMNNFFSDDKYLAIKEQYFNDSVSDITEIAKYKC